MPGRLRQVGSRINWWLGLAGNTHLAYTVLFGGAAAAVLTTAVGYAVSFLDFVSGIPLFFRVAFYFSAFVLMFSLVNHVRQRLPRWWDSRGGTVNENLARKRKAVNDLLGNALEEGLSLKQGRTYDLEGENLDKEEDELLNEYYAKYEGEIRTWVDRTYDLIHDAFGKAQAQRFISNEGLSEEEVFGRKLPRFMYRTSTQRKYSIPARLKRLDAVIDRANELPIDPDFDPDEWTNG